MVMTLQGLEFMTRRIYFERMLLVSLWATMSNPRPTGSQEHADSNLCDYPKPLHRLAVKPLAAPQPKRPYIRR